MVITNISIAIQHNRKNPDSGPKSKLKDRRRPIRFLFKISQSSICIMYQDKNKTGTKRTGNFKVRHPQSDQFTTTANDLKNYAQRAPTKIENLTGSPRTQSKARQYPDTIKWAQPHYAELDQLGQHNAIEWLTTQESQTITGKPILITMIYCYK